MNIPKPLRWIFVLFICFVSLYSFGAAAFMEKFTAGNPLFVKFMATPITSLMHFIGGGIALFLGIFQFSKKLRKKSIKLHRYLGFLYFLGVFCSGIGGLYMALHANGGLVGKLGFGTLDLFWLSTAYLALSTAIKGNIKAHRFWIYLNYSLTLGAVSLRLQLPLGILFFGFESSYPIIAWSCWVPNILIAYWVVKEKRPQAVMVAK